MNGNVAEWVWDRYAEDTYKKRNGLFVAPRGVPEGTLRVKRGGNWDNGAHRIRTVYRDSGSPSKRAKKTGFRLVRVAF